MQAGVGIKGLKMDNQEHEIIGSIYDAAVDVSLWPQVIENIVQYHQGWRQKGGVELFKANNKRLRFAKMVIKLIDDLEPIRKALL